MGAAQPGRRVERRRLREVLPYAIASSTIQPNDFDAVRTTFETLTQLCDVDEAQPVAVFCANWAA